MTIKRSILVLSLVLVSMITVSCAGDSGKYKSKPYYKVGTPYTIYGITYVPKEEPDYVEEGVASWYGSEFHGKETANGDRFDSNSMTAAHRTLPMPSMVKVTNLANNKSVTLMVNDRGPFSKSRIIDVSKRAAEELGFKNKGTTRVRVEFLKEQSNQLLARFDNKQYQKNIKQQGTSLAQNLVKDNPATQLSNNFYIQAGSFANIQNAQQASSKLNDIGTVSIENSNNLYRVRIGPLASAETANVSVNKVVQLGYNDAIVISE